MPPTFAPAVTGMGAVSALGQGCAAMREALDQGRDGIGRVTRFPTAGLTSPWGATVPATWADELAGQGPVELCIALARAAAGEAWTSAHVAAAGLPAGRIALVLGTSVGGHAVGLHCIAEEVATPLGITGPVVTVSTACASSAGALEVARALLARGDADLVVAGGADVLSAEVFAGFSALGLLCPEKCAPFGQPFGTTLGEGAGFVVLESTAQAHARGMAPRAWLQGFGLSSDAYHVTAPDPTGAGIARAIRTALDDAGLGPDRVDYVNAHGTGTLANDTAEWKAIRTVFGARAERLPVSATKSYLGHAQAAAGVLELIATLLCLERDLIPPTLRHRQPRSFSPPDVVAGERPRALAVAHAVCNSSAFGGANAMVVLGRRELPPRARLRRPVHVLGSGWVGPAGVGSGRHAADGGRDGRVPAFDLRALVPSFDTSGLDPLSRFLLGATAQALRDARIVVRGELRDRAGLLVGARVVSASSAAEFNASIAERGLAQPKVTAFTRLVLNAPAGIACQALALRGPTNTLAIGRGGGLLAIVDAAERLATGDDVELMVAGGCDEADGCDAAAGGEGAACLVLGRAERAVAGRRPVVVAGWAVGGAGAFPATAGLALERAGLAPQDIAGVYGDAAARSAWPHAIAVGGPDAPAAEAAFAAAAAYDELRQERARAVLVGSAASTSASVAVVLVADDEKELS